MLKDLVLSNRSYRRFNQEKHIDKKTLMKLVDMARLTPSSRNIQTLKFFISNDSSTNAKIFPHVAWAGYLKDWPGPKEGERPSAYIVIMEDTNIGEEFQRDQGIAAQTIMLGAAEQNIGGCMIASVKRKELASVLALPDHLNIELVLALGFPKEEVVIEDVKNDGDIKYWRDENGIHHVPKRGLDELIV
ncbi:MAG: nitroreductase family protein [Bacteroidales bacterium]